jgi:hypothetical protein
MLGGFSPFISGQTQNLKKKSNYSAQIKLHNGTPTLFVDGKPAFYGAWWCSAPQVDSWANAGLGSDYAQETGIHIYAFDVGGEEWCGPGEGRSSHFDFSTVKERFSRIIKEDPKALFHLRSTWRDGQSGGMTFTQRNVKLSRMEAATGNLLPQKFGESRPRNSCALISPIFKKLV